jgi:hypothetical protein
VRYSPEILGAARDARLFQLGAWCSGIAPAQHVGGPGLSPQRAHTLRAGRAAVLGATPARRVLFRATPPRFPQVSLADFRQPVTRLPAPRAARWAAMEKFP